MASAVEKGDAQQFRRSSRGTLPSPFPDRPGELSVPGSAEEANTRPGTGGSSSLPPKERAFKADGPVEAFALTADMQFWENYTDLRTIGKGHFAKVKQIQHIKTGEHFAVKVLDKSLADNDIEDLVREFQMLRALRHPNVIRLYAAYETPRKLYLVTELATGGEVSHRAALMKCCACVGWLAV